ncbi:cystatin-F [Maylandia zebra]|uniref:Cystatin-F n=2 Tax=Haplochromini TaxID=319058 RepID=A0A9Y3S0Q0_9CICH|nr:PREDICTED: cystatin-F-like [Pundamilia nyererei]XP_026046017.1 cystatin-F [Astatotilapia calliptera]
MEVKMLLLVFVLAALEGTLVSGWHHHPSMPGSPHNISKNDRGLQQVVLNATYFFNNESNDAFLFKPATIDRAQKQIVKGVRYMADFQISRTVCRKRDKNNDLSRCDFQPPGPLHQVFQCHVDVWMIPWEKPQKKNFNLLCKQ